MQNTRNISKDVDTEFINKITNLINDRMAKDKFANPLELNNMSVNKATIEELISLLSDAGYVLKTKLFFPTSENEKYDGQKISNSTSSIVISIPSPSVNEDLRTSEHDTSGMEM